MKKVVEDSAGDRRFIVVKGHGQFDAFDFEDYVEANYGIKMNFVDGNITDGFVIMDEKKYLLFTLKFK